MAITKKHDWVKGFWAFGFQVITPNGTTMDFELPAVSEVRGNDLWKILGPMLETAVLNDADKKGKLFVVASCCERDHDHDGNCDRHPEVLSLSEIEERWMKGEMNQAEALSGILAWARREVDPEWKIPE